MTGRPWVVAPEQSEDSTKGSEVQLLDYKQVIVPLQLPVTSRQREKVAAISSNITW